MIERFNKVSLWAASSVLWQEKISDRIEAYQKLIKIVEVKIFYLFKFHAKSFLVFEGN